MKTDPTDSYPRMAASAEGGGGAGGVNLFRIPHSRMKELVASNLVPLTVTSNVDSALTSDSLESLLQDVYEAMWELKSHEYIENHFIMDRLKARLQARRVRPSFLS